MGTTTNRRTRHIEPLDWIKLHSYARKKADNDNNIQAETLGALCADILDNTGVDVSVRGVAKNFTKLGYNVVTNLDVDKLLADLRDARAEIERLNEVIRRMEAK